ncbi:uncharacterized protein LOC121600688 [Anopheles merus]|uniref:uncharacterized protein LOC121600688 n=1 Tax=Anopheles merus TaxID=30066 RepID=UPI001BE465E2|nr:uncharacterized protein LOC121600688 [Anopheles merus]
MTKADKLKSRQAKRQSLIVSMQRLAQFAKDYTPQQQQQIPDRLDRLSKIWECFQMVQEDCEEWDDSENATSENEALLSQAEELYFETKAALTRYIPETADQVKEEVTRPANHVSGKENPADMISRGVAVNEFLSSDLWRHGPSWLREPKGSWPLQTPDNNITVEDERKVSILTTQVTEINPIFQRFSTLQPLLRIFGFCLRFINNTRKSNKRISLNVLLVKEIQHAKRALCKMVQATEFSVELQALKRNEGLAKVSSIRLLNPFIDNDGLIRVGGRLRHSDLSHDAKHPILMPAFHPFTRLLIMDHHLKTMHGGVSMTLSSIREEIWPLNGMRAVRSVTRTCFNCVRANPTPIIQPIGQLPISRVTINEVFSCVGVDYCGPLYLRPSHRKAASPKAYVCVFVCMSTKAVHLELAGDLSTTTFLMALDRFVSRRGKPKNIYSDNGTNFIGAKNALHEIYQFLHKDNNKITNHLSNENIQWHLIPPRAPNFGGLWEAAVKVAKTHLVRQLGTAQLSYESMCTLLTKLKDV